MFASFHRANTLTRFHSLGTSAGWAAFPFASLSLRSEVSSPWVLARCLCRGFKTSGLKSRQLLDISIPSFKVWAADAVGQPLGHLAVQHLPLMQILRRPGASGAPRAEGTAGPVDARDITALGITQEGRLEDAQTTPCILPRHGCLLLAIGPIRAIIYTDAAYILGAEDTAVVPMAECIAARLGHCADMETCIAQADDETALPENKDMRFTTQYAFELSFLEATLEEVCSELQKHAALLSGVADAVVRGIQAASPDDVVDRLVHSSPLLDELGKLELQIRELDECLTDLLKSDEDMTDMLLTAIEKNRPVHADSDDHDEVELILEAYHRKLRKSLLQLDGCGKKVRFGMSLSDVKLGAYRSRLNKLQVHVSVAGVSLGICAAVAGFFGMNVPVPFPENESAFLFIVAGCLAIGGSLYAGVLRATMGAGAAKVERERMELAIASQKVLGNILTVQSVMKKAGVFQNPTAARGNEFKQLLEQQLGYTVSAIELSCIVEFVEASRNSENSDRG